MGAISWAAVSGVPTLGQLALILLSMALMTLAVMFLRRDRGSLQTWLIALALAGSGVFMGDLGLRHALANGGGIIVGSGSYACSGGTAAFSTDTTFENQCSTAIHVTRLTPCQVAPTSAPSGSARPRVNGFCQVGYRLQTGESCSLSCFVPG